MHAILKIYNWDSRRNVVLDREVEVGQRYVIQTNYGQFVGTPVYVKPEEKKEDIAISEPQENTSQGGNDFYAEVLREVTENDLKKLAEFKEKEKEAFETCRDKIKQYDLPMKLVGANYSLDGGNLVFAFTAENRVDFRELVRDLSHVFQKAVRLEQIGSRDEARICSGYGPCGRELCCANFSGILKSINTEMARIQQITHRGSERISGCCGRLMCCLSYEMDHYGELVQGIPSTGTEVKTRDGKGVVKSVKVLQRKVLVELASGEKRWYDVNSIR